MMGEPLKKKFPYITPKFIVGGSKPGTSITELIAAGQKIDIMFFSIGATPPTLLDPKMEYDISPLIKKYDYDLSTLEPTTVNMAKQIAKDRNTAMFLEITGTHAAQLEGMNFDIATFPVFKDAPSVGPQRCCPKNTVLRAQ
ncbi:hypothetical protein ACFFNY_08110 [Paenibacillus hodogayensis]|uniref:Uncharacterized protein n=1 Tax=Paenibacillus hodogayensis TaxID=279208 RepID=A0ABV5VTC3_9BACL